MADKLRTYVSHAKAMIGFKSLSRELIVFQ